MSNSLTVQRVLAQLDADGTIKVSSTSVSLPRHYQSASALLSQARTYQRSGDVEVSYILYRRFMVYLLTTIHHHPQYNLTQHNNMKLEYRRHANDALNQLEQLRQVITAKYTEDEEEDEPQQPTPSPPQPEVREELKEEDAASEGTEGAAIDAALEARMAALVLSTEDVVEERKEDSTLSTDLPLSYRPPSPPPHSLMATAFTLTPTPPPEPSAPPFDDPDFIPGPLPSLPSPSPSSSEPSPTSLTKADTRHKWANLRMPVRPPSTPALPTSPQPVPRPSPSSLIPSSLRAAGAPSHPIPRPLPPPSRPHPFSFSTSTLRPLHFPASLMSTFLSYALPNTTQNIETCAILAGRLTPPHLLITHCIIPPQTATSSTCSTIDELSLLTTQSSLDLLTLGWIHTHPSQSCFLSAVDLHTQYGYQMMMGEAVAAVMAPSKGGREGEGWGVFGLSREGLDVLGRCDRSGFHEHETGQGKLYGKADHVVMVKGDVTFIDLRKGGGGERGQAGGGGVGKRTGDSSLYPGLRSAQPR